MKAKFNSIEQVTDKMLQIAESFDAVFNCDRPQLITSDMRVYAKQVNESKADIVYFGSYFQKYYIRKQGVDTTSDKKEIVATLSVSYDKIEGYEVNLTSLCK